MFKTKLDMKIVKADNIWFIKSIINGCVCYERNRPNLIKGPMQSIMIGNAMAFASRVIEGSKVR